MKETLSNTYINRALSKEKGIRFQAVTAKSS